MFPRQFLLAGGGFLAGVALTAATLSQPVAADQADAAYLAAQKAQVIATTYQLDTAGFHELDESAKAGTLPAGTLGKVRRARIATAATDWPASMQATARDLATQMKALEQALRDENAAAASDSATRVHDLGHDLSAMAYDYLGSNNQASPEHGSHGQGAAGTPSPGESSQGAGQDDGQGEQGGTSTGH
ncbi:MAG: hypothetical protein IT305_16850 [Chloroflexi bacterium]|nr:hypothetical protein [Chloroflexota bacterium]